ncbi:MAG: TnpV protein [Candidatus Coproplasma sp.]
MNKQEILRKAEANEEMTVAEIRAYQKLVKPEKQVYGKYGSMAKHYIEEHNFGKLLSLAGHLHEYLHGVDRRANELYDVMYAQLSEREEYKKTGNYLEDVRRANAMKEVIEEAILNQIVYETI